jgi:hypothetical protein
MAEAIKFKEDKTIIKNADGRQKEISTFWSVSGDIVITSVPSWYGRDAPEAVLLYRKYYQSFGDWCVVLEVVLILYRNWLVWIKFTNISVFVPEVMCTCVGVEWFQLEARSGGLDRYPPAAALWRIHLSSGCVGSHWGFPGPQPCTSHWEYHNHSSCVKVVLFEY